MRNTFKYYKKLRSQMDTWANIRGSRWGIAVDSDEYALKWQSKRMSLEILEAALEERNPDWFNANYLSIEEAKKRNESYN